MVEKRYIKRKNQNTEENYNAKRHMNVNFKEQTMISKKINKL